ncbi:zinc-ribbon domain-containing protein [Effusibacillus dendaii]|uniref:zinc-ribbon domain-containing protein n=1 Tax=Effusibacillus dendaii TaxID=2743772 RepID=UPI00190CC321|nr:zinc-ribbon domain-containing protein [Effusibacillus dendaii]
MEWTAHNKLIEHAEFKRSQERYVKRIKHKEILNCIKNTYHNVREEVLAISDFSRHLVGHGGHNYGHDNDHYREPDYAPPQPPASIPKTGSTIICPNCGEENGSTHKFCYNCGSNLQPQPATCPNCNASVPKDATFCPNCGYKLKS